MRGRPAVRAAAGLQVAQHAGPVDEAEQPPVLHDGELARRRSWPGGGGPPPPARRARRVCRRSTRRHHVLHLVDAPGCLVGALQVGQADQPLEVAVVVLHRQAARVQGEEVVVGRLAQGDVAGDPGGRQRHEAPHRHAGQAALGAALLVGRLRGLHHDPADEAEPHAADVALCCQNDQQRGRRRS